MSGRKEVPPSRHFFLNERHQLTNLEKSGGGSPSKYVGINWAQKGKAIEASAKKVREQYAKTVDPIKGSHYFLVALPDKTLKKHSDAGGKSVDKDVPADFSTNYPMVFHRIGMDLLRLDSKGRALVHVTPERFAAIEAVTGNLLASGTKEQERWAAISKFDLMSWTEKVDEKWLKEGIGAKAGEAILELQPMLSKTEVDSVLGGVVEYLSRQKQEQILGSGTDYSGRQWFRTNLTAETIKKLAESFHSIQSFHTPLTTSVQSPDMLAGWSETIAGVQNIVDPDIDTLPSVAILDTGVSENHPLLAPYYRNRLIDPQSIGRAEGSHGTQVASKIVFGHCDPRNQNGLLTKYRCKFADILITKDAEHIEDKAVVSALNSAASNFRDIRTFNMSFGDLVPLESFSEQDRGEKLSQLRDLDNLIFNEDILVIVAAGNSSPNLRPNPQYPDSYKDPLWRLPAWARGFNTLVCGSFVDELRANGSTQTKGWPSPFSRVGPGVSEAPVPNFSEHGGDTNGTYSGGFGVAVCDRNGRWRESAGTSYAAPLLARKAAHAYKELEKFCLGTTRPYSALVKAFMALSANIPATALQNNVKAITEKTLGRGLVNLDLLSSPADNAAIFFWQGVLESPKDVIRVQVPIPKSWLTKAGKPKLRVVWAWESPVHDGVSGIWACRRVNLAFRPGPEKEAFVGSRGSHSHSSYTIREKVVDLGTEALNKKKIEVTGDSWLIELSYEQLADYYPGREFSPKQRVGLVIELSDGEGKESPQRFVQALSIANTFDRLVVAPTKVEPPVPIKV
jgi:hypothetical protein